MNAEVGFPQTTNFSTSDGLELEAEFLLPKKIKAIAVLSHPHPLYGGEMHNNIIQSLFESLPESSIGTLRYNFRGAGLSEGTHGKGELERLDVEAAFTYAGSLGGSIPVISVGYSFGADVSLSTDHSNLAGWVGIAAPLSLLEPQQMPAGHDKRPTLLLVPQHDQYRPPDEAATTSHSWVSTSLSIIDGGDHFLMGRSKPVTEATAAFVKTIIDS